MIYLDKIFLALFALIILIEGVALCYVGERPWGIGSLIIAAIILIILVVTPGDENV